MSLLATCLPTSSPARVRTLAGLTFSGSAYIAVHLLGHFNLVHAWTLPLCALAWIASAQGPTALRGVVLGAAFAVTIYVDYYDALYAAIVAALWWVLATVHVRRREGPRPKPRRPPRRCLSRRSY